MRIVLRCFKYIFGSCSFVAGVMALVSRISFKNFGRLKLTLVIAMFGFLTDMLITNWMLRSSHLFYENNPLLYPEIGLPLMVLNYIFADQIFPRNIFCDNVLYALSLTQWSATVQNLLVLFNITHGINLFFALPFVLVTIYIVLGFRAKSDTTFSLRSLGKS
jgi:hypothetical protein